MTRRIVVMIWMTVSLTAAHSEEPAKIFPAGALRALDIRCGGGDIRVEGGEAREIRNFCN